MKKSGKLGAAVLLLCGAGDGFFLRHAASVPAGGGYRQHGACH